ncbi:MAG: hypothetical protein H6719_22380 [Sandaracinaceae bacterium]|nr:hypothetical protein [Sandaracinaceae bacterium]
MRTIFFIFFIRRALVPTLARVVWDRLEERFELEAHDVGAPIAVGGHQARPRVARRREHLDRGEAELEPFVFPTAPVYRCASRPGSRIPAMRDVARRSRNDETDEERPHGPPWAVAMGRRSL